jgi:FkbM family methyltransferase
MELTTDLATGLYYRLNTADKTTLSEYKREKRYFKLLDNKVIFDVGANIGIFTYHALKHGAKRIIAYEIDKENCEVFLKQAFPNTELIQAGIATKNEIFTIKRKGVNSHKLATLGKFNFDKEKIQGLSFVEQYQKYDPDVIKMDIEGGELDLDFSVIKPGVLLIIEIHYLNKTREKAEKLFDYVNVNFNKLYSSMARLKGKPYQVQFVGIKF